MGKAFHRKGNHKIRRSIFIFLSGDMKIFLGTSSKQRRRIKKFIKKCMERIMKAISEKELYKRGEWCWFWNKHMSRNEHPRLARFEFSTQELQTPMDFPAFYQTKYKPIELGYTYDYCEPFIGELPTYFKQGEL